MSIRQVGRITDYTVIEAVGRTLAELLMTEMESPVPVTIASPGEDYGVPVGDNGEELGISRINLFLYRVEEPPHSRNNDWVNAGDGKQIPYPLTLSLFYMLNIFTPDNNNNLDEHRILGDVMRVFHSHPVIDPIYFEGTLNPNDPPFGLPWEELKIVNHPLPLDQLAAVWHAINKPYRLSVVYEVSAVQISPPEFKSRRVRRVETTHVKAVPFSGRPAINDIAPGRCYAGDAVAINGAGFSSSYLKVYLNDSLIIPDKISPEKIELHFPADVPPGLYSIKVCNEQGCSADNRIEEISPFLYRLNPESKYTEDSDFPRTGGGDPFIIIYGGNFLPAPALPVEILVTPEGKASETFTVAKEDLGNNSIRWVIPSDMRKGKSELKIRQAGIRISNALILEIPSPAVYRVNSEIVTTLPGELIIIGNYFRPANTLFYLHPGSLANISDLTDADKLSLTVVNENELHADLPGTLADGKYQLVVCVYGKYYSEPLEIKINKGP
jgi:hypothetical protein